MPLVGIYPMDNNTQNICTRKLKTVYFNCEHPWKGDHIRQRMVRSHNSILYGYKKEKGRSVCTNMKISRGYIIHNGEKNTNSEC